MATVWDELRQGSVASAHATVSLMLVAAEQCAVDGGRWPLAPSLLHQMQGAGLTRDAISYDAAISACEKGGQWQEGLLLLKEMQDVAVTSDVISSYAATSACEKGMRWQKALSFAQRDAGRRRDA